MQPTLPVPSKLNKNITSSGAPSISEKTDRSNHSTPGRVHLCGLCGHQNPGNVKQCLNCDAVLGKNCPIYCAKSDSGWQMNSGNETMKQ